MKRQFDFVNVARIGWILLMFLTFIGCTPHSDTMPRTSMDSDFDEALDRVQTPRSGTLEFGDRISVKISGVEDRHERKRCLDKFRRIILQSKLDASNYSDRSSQLSVVEDFAGAYLFTLKRCNLTFDDAVEFRLEFLEKIKRDIEMMSKVAATGGEDTVIGVHWSADMYLDRLKSCHDLHLRYLEDSFNEHVKKMSHVEIDDTRRKIENAIGRSIRTSEQILRDRRHTLRKYNVNLLAPNHDEKVHVEL